MHDKKNKSNNLTKKNVTSNNKSTCIMYNISPYIHSILKKKVILWVLYNWIIITDALKCKQQF